MKTFSIFIICITLGIFYTLAVQQQNSLHEKDLKRRTAETSMNNVNSGAYMSTYKHVEEDFSMHVTGKEHRYLNTGISWIEYDTETNNNHVIVAHTEDDKIKLSGS